MFQMFKRTVILLICLPIAMSIKVKKFPLLMPNVHPDVDELYLCTAVKLVHDESFYIVGFKPNATMQTAHHMLLYGCSVPGSDELYWDCGEMAQSESQNNLVRASPCAVNSSVVYAWARDAKTLTLPSDVGFQVGKGTQIKYLVLQVHYAHTERFKDGSTDDSGVFLMYTNKPRSKLAGVVLLGTGGSIPPMSTTHMETECMISENKTIYPFAYRTHTHSLGKVVSGYSIHVDRNNKDTWTLLGKRDPMTPQMFYPVFNRNSITFRDRLAARCTMNSNRRMYTRIGVTNKDEMCNFYLMYYVIHGLPLEMKYCFTQGPPYYFWDNPENNLNNIPNIDASSL